MRLYIGIFLMLFLATVAGACVSDGICTPAEREEGCDDCSFGTAFSGCVNDGMCTIGEREHGCADCSTANTNRCISDDVCTLSEQELGDCPDCSPADYTGFIVFAGGISIVGVVMVLMLLAAMALFKGAKHVANGGRRIRM